MCYNLFIKGEFFVKKVIVECLGIFIFVFFGIGIVVLGNGMEGIGIMGIVLVFGLIIVVVVYSIGIILGVYLNLVVFLGMWFNK